MIDSHTGGEPTRVVVSGGPDLGNGSMSDRLQRFRDQFDTFRSAVVNEPRGSDVLVGALLTEPTAPSCTAGVLFFNNVGYLGMCGHGTIGLLVTLAYLRRIAPGQSSAEDARIYRIETPVGIVTTRLNKDGSVSVENVPSYRYASQVTVEVPGWGWVTGDVAWGGNWFFLVSDHGKELILANSEVLTEFTWAIRHSLTENGITGKNSAEIDHVELFARSSTPGVHSRNFVLCPGKAYDRSPCGTGTSAKLACLFADGKLREGEIWRQESIIGSIFEGTVRIAEGGTVIPTITGTAFVTADATLILDPEDPFCEGIRG